MPRMIISPNRDQGAILHEKYQAITVRLAILRMTLESTIIEGNILQDQFVCRGS